MKEDLVFVTAQPDVPYFHWQVRVYSQNFIDLGIDPSKIHVIFGMVQGNTEPTKESLELGDLGINVHHYLDDRQKKHYIPSIKPFLIYKWLEENPEAEADEFTAKQKEVEQVANPIMRKVYQGKGAPGSAGGDEEPEFGDDEL